MNFEETTTGEGKEELSPTDDSLEMSPVRSRRPLFMALVGLIGLMLCLGGAFYLIWPEDRPLRPFRGQPTGVAFVIDGQPVLVTFPELSDNAADYHNKRIRVTGQYLPLTPPECSPFNGPLFYWSMVSQGLQLNARGFGSALQIVSPGTNLTVEGIWRLYTGPAGCGKEPATGNIWYLDVERIVQPNPLVAGTRDLSAYLLQGISTPMFPTVGPTSQAQATTGATPTLLNTATRTATPTATATNGGVVTTGTATATGTATTTATGTPRFGTPTGTPSPGTPTATATATVTGTPPPTNTLAPPPTNPPTGPYPTQGPGY